MGFVSTIGEETGEVAVARLGACAEIVGRIVAALESGGKVELELYKREASSKYKLGRMPKLVELIAAVPAEHKARVTPLLKAKPVRTASGVAVVAVMSKPHRCPHIFRTGAVCIYCPGGPDSDFEYSAQSYTGFEPTSMRAIRARYDPYIQARGRIDQLASLGHSVEKIEYIIMGGTFMSLDKGYREEFICALHDACSGHNSLTVGEATQFSEHARNKPIGITIETRPDYCQPRHLTDMLHYGCTRLEVGVQSVYEDVTRDTNRGHSVEDVCRVFRVAKDTGYKVITHMMPDLPRTGVERDLAAFRELFDAPRFRPDGLKVYPTLVIRGTGLYELWKAGMYQNYEPGFLVEVVARMLGTVPPWTRVYRVQRDIPMPLVSSGVEKGNLRELALARMRDLGLVCRDVRTREVGIQDIHHGFRPEQVELVRRDYYGNDGWETFLTYEDPTLDVLVGLLRLRRTSVHAFRPELQGRTSVVRELHVYGSAVPVHSRDPTLFQHQGFGSLLMEEAERIARDEHGSEKLVVISGVGTRHYYRRLGYALDGPYVSKRIGIAVGASRGHFRTPAQQRHVKEMYDDTLLLHDNQVALY